MATTDRTAKFLPVLLVLLSLPQGIGEQDRIDARDRGNDPQAYKTLESRRRALLIRLARDVKRNSYSTVRTVADVRDELVAAVGNNPELQRLAGQLVDDVFAEEARDLKAVDAKAFALANGPTPKAAGDKPKRVRNRSKKTASSSAAQPKASTSGKSARPPMAQPTSSSPAKPKRVRNRSKKTASSSAAQQGPEPS